jgi:hypothetical protein
VDADPLAGFSFFVDVDLTGRVVPNDYDCEIRFATLFKQKSPRFYGDFCFDGVRDWPTRQ